MTPTQMKRVQQQVAVIVGLLHGLDIEGALALMDRVANQAKVVDPILWAKAKPAHERMTRLMDAARTFQRTTEHVRDEIPVAPKVLLS